MTPLQRAVCIEADIITRAGMLAMQHQKKCVRLRELAARASCPRLRVRITAQACAQYELAHEALDIAEAAARRIGPLTDRLNAEYNALERETLARLDAEREPESGSLVHGEALRR